MNYKLVFWGLLLLLFTSQALAISDTNLVSWYKLDEPTYNKAIQTIQETQGLIEVFV